MDNCDLSSYNLTLLSPDGSTTNVNNVPNGVSLTYSNLLQGISKVTFKATDARNNSSDCSFNITVKDNEKPILSNIPPNVTIHCNDNFPTIPSPIINDNCDGSPALTAASSLAIGNCTLGAPAEIHSYSWTATDESGNESTANWEVTVISDFSFNLGAPIEICDASNYIIDPGNIGESYAWSTGASSQAISVSSSGTYKVTITSKNGCCYESEKTVAFSSPPDATAMGATLNCEATEVQIFGSSTASGASYSWTGPGGFMSDMQNPMVSSLGEYILTVTNAAGCGSTASALVIGDTDIPDVSAEGGTINCETTSIQLMGSSASSGVTFSWTGPDGFTSDMQNPTVSTPGNYILNVQSGNGCSGSADALVIDDTSPPEIILSEGILSCAQSEIELSVEGEASWTGPDGFTSSDETIVVSTPGTYSVTVTGSNSCTNSETVEILSDLSVPDISAEGGIINCVSGQTTLSGNSTTEGATYSWTGPGDFTTEIQNPIAIIAGTYTLIVTGPNGCSSTMAVEVSADMDAPEVSVNDGSVDCVNTSTELTASTTSENITFIWSGPNGFTADGESITVSEPGEYLVMAVNENGCAGSATSTVAANNIIPTVSIFVGPIGCQTTDVTFATEVSEGVTTYSWTGPNNFTSNEKEPVITEIGTYTLNVTSENGCTSMASFDVISDSEVPDANATVDGLLTCTQNTITLMGNTSTDTVSFFWTGPDDFTSTLQNPTVSQPGVYMLSVIAANGCAGQSSVEVMGDGEFPTVNATGGDINCNNSSVILLGTTNIENATFRWEGPNGFATSISNPEVEIAGEYTFTVTSEGGCVAFKTVTVNIDNQDPNLSLSEGFLDCNAGVRNFRVVTNAQDPTILWTGPDNYSSTELNAPYSQAGIYSLSVTGSNGCSSQLSIEVDHDIAYVHTLNITGNDASLEIEGGTPPFIITWDNDIEGSEVSDLADGEHFVKIVDGLDCTKFVEFTISTSSVTDLEKALELKIYPNPVVDQLKIEWVTTDFEPKNLEIINANGRKLQRTDIAGKNNQVVDMSDLTPGIYFVRMEGKDSVIYKKFLKM
ncbi:hypothetical protein GCM10007940_25460 [Portibacter lacus]|uniref:Ig-like domain-containing protein n=2 Tax=Portibacter lacus TaxID=1099794 RepID=A0AA37SSB5_9BACT|nr:hypothetical protein GCM10007940_25460 [Portibacter lacus]